MASLKQNNHYLYNNKAIALLKKHDIEHTNLILQP